MNYLKTSYFIFLIFTLFQGCQNQSNPSNTPESKKEKATVNSDTSESRNEYEKWADFINLKSDSIRFLYTENAVKILENEEIIKGRASIKNHFLTDPFVVKSVQSDTVIMANQERGLAYEIGEYLDENNQGYKSVIIWETKNAERQRVFEFVAKVGETSNNLSELEERRALWVKLCNEHNAEALVNELYSSNTIYFNHKPIIQGRESVIEEYQYMNNEQYELSLHPIIVEVVNSNFIFEIGQCKGSYGGKYILIWQKGKNEAWEIFIDSNI